MSTILAHSGKAVLQHGSDNMPLYRVVALVWGERPEHRQHITQMFHLSKDGWLPPPGNDGTPFIETRDAILIWDPGSGSYRPFVEAPIDPAFPWKGVANYSRLLPVGDQTAQLREVLALTKANGELLKGLGVKDRLTNERIERAEAADGRLFGLVAELRERTDVLYDEGRRAHERADFLEQRLGNAEQHAALVPLLERLDAHDTRLNAVFGAYERLNEAVGALEYAASQGPVTPEAEATLEEAWADEKAGEHAIGGTDLAGQDLPEDRAELHPPRQPLAVYAVVHHPDDPPPPLDAVTRLHTPAPDHEARYYLRPGRPGVQSGIDYCEQGAIYVVREGNQADRRRFTREAIDLAAFDPFAPKAAAATEAPTPAPVSAEAAEELARLWTEGYVASGKARDFYRVGWDDLPPFLREERVAAAKYTLEHATETLATLKLWAGDGRGVVYNLDEGAFEAARAIVAEHLRQRAMWSLAHDRRHTDAEWSSIFDIYLGRFAEAALSGRNTRHLSGRNTRHEATILGALCLSYLESRA